MALSVRYAAGTGAAVAAPGAVLLAATSAASPTVRDMWARMITGLDRGNLLAAMTESGLVRLDTFALLLDADHGGLVLVRGAARVVLHTLDGDVPVGTAPSSTWTEVALPPGTTGADLVLDDAEDAEIPASAGVFPAVRLVVDLVGAGAPATPAADPVHPAAFGFGSDDPSSAGGLPPVPGVPFETPAFAPPAPPVAPPPFAPPTAHDEHGISGDLGTSELPDAADPSEVEVADIGMAEVVADEAVAAAPGAPTDAADEDDVAPLDDLLVPADGPAPADEEPAVEPAPLDTAAAPAVDEPAVVVPAAPLPADDPWAGLLPLDPPAADDDPPSGLFHLDGSTPESGDDAFLIDPAPVEPSVVDPAAIDAPPLVPPPLVPPGPPGPPPTAAPPPPPPGPPPTAWHDDPSTELLVPASAELAEPAGPVGVLVLPDGSRVELDHDAVLGRSPAWAGPGDRQLVVVKSPFGDVSRSHVAITVADGKAYADDLGSTNGTLLAQPAGQEHLLRPGYPEQLEPGAMITLAKDVTVTFETV